jgi:UDP-GlcNAc:undecaprenyl-phosphate GlcNAc-1-phosphate transferase
VTPARCSSDSSSPPPRRLPGSSWFLLVLSGVAYLALRRLGYINLEKTQRLLQDRRRNLELRAVIRRISNSLRSARSVDEAWIALGFAAEALGAFAVALHLPTKGKAIRIALPRGSTRPAWSYSAPVDPW